MSWRPTRKVVAAGVVGGPVSVILVWLFHLGGHEMPSEVAAAVATLVNVAVAYCVRDDRGPQRHGP